MRRNIRSGNFKMHSASNSKVCLVLLMYQITTRSCKMESSTPRNAYYTQEVNGNNHTIDLTCPSSRLLKAMRMVPNFVSLPNSLDNGNDHRETKRASRWKHAWTIQGLFLNKIIWTMFKRKIMPNLLMIPVPVLALVSVMINWHRICM